MTRTEIWVKFAAHGPSYTASTRAQLADALLLEFDKRWVQSKYPNAKGEFPWIMAAIKGGHSWVGR